MSDERRATSGDIAIVQSRHPWAYWTSVHCTDEPPTGTLCGITTRARWTVEIEAPGTVLALCMLPHSVSLWCLDTCGATLSVRYRIHRGPSCAHIYSLMGRPAHPASLRSGFLHDWRAGRRWAPNPQPAGQLFFGRFTTSPLPLPHKCVCSLPLEHPRRTAVSCLPRLVPSPLQPHRLGVPCQGGAAAALCRQCGSSCPAASRGLWHCSSWEQRQQALSRTPLTVSHDMPVLVLLVGADSEDESGAAGEAGGGDVGGWRDTE